MSRKLSQEQFRCLLEVKREFIEELWRRQKRMSNRSLTWLLEGGGGVKLLLFTQKPQTTSVYCPSDNYLKNKFGGVENEPIVYGGVEINDDERSLLTLPPKFAVIEHIDVHELTLELKRAGIKGRWHQRSKEESEKSLEEGGDQMLNGRAKLEQEVIDTNYWLKGSLNVP